ncbi:MAG TPA: tyrosine-type recombinase/integrase [Saprospiraceae bacterium]|nr:tyrosine-type recombinase/integrase [Saprospiraceae bacterium]
MHTGYISARLVRKNRWYILYYQVDPLTDKRVRFRETFDLNRIQDLSERLAKANLIIRDINRKLPDGYPFDADYYSKIKKTNLLDAIEKAAAIKCNTDRERTRHGIESMVRIFRMFIEKNQLQDMRIGAFDHRHALAFLDYAAMERKVGNRTYNNYIERMRAMCTELVQRGYLDENPFSKMKNKKVSGKLRRAFNEYERSVVANHIFMTDKWLMLGVLLQYHCFIRPVELRRLRFYMFDFETGVIRLTKNETKNKENATVTIPDSIIPFLKNFNFGQWNQRWLIFGKDIQPHPNLSCGHNSLNYRHRMIIEKLNKSKQLKDINGLTFYSWKDTGAMELFKRKINILEIRKQLRHKDLKTTQVYCESLYEINEEIKHLDGGLIAPALLQMPYSID